MERRVTKILLLLLLLQQLVAMGETITKRQTMSKSETNFPVQCSDDPCSTIEAQNCTFSGEVHLILANDSNDITFAEDDGEVSITVSLSKVLSQRFIATYRLISGTASVEEDIVLSSGEDVQVLAFEVGQESQQITLTIYDDILQEMDESLLLVVMAKDCCVQMDGALVAGITILDNDRTSDIATIGFDKSQYAFQENEGTVNVGVNIQPQQPLECEVMYRVISSTACVGGDVVGTESIQSIFIPVGEVATNISIQLIDDTVEEDNETFFVILIGSNCCSRLPTLATSVTTAEIIDDDEATVSGDPHFTVPLLSGQTLCYGVQGYPGLAFNLVSNYHFVINALFIDDASQNDTDATWIGKLAIIPRNVEQEPVIIFDSSTQQVIIKNQSEFKASIVRQISISGSNAVNVKFTKGISKHQSSPMVHVIYRHPMASFSITFHSNHLDVDWHIQDEYLTQSHGLMGQFMGKGVEVNEIKSILIRPNFSPIPVAKSSYQSAEVTKRCWKSMNVGNQGQDLIEGTILDYVVPSLTDKTFAFKHST